MSREQISMPVNAVVVIITRLKKLTRLPSERELPMAYGQGQGSIRHIENPTHIIYVYSALFSYL